MHTEMSVVIINMTPTLKPWNDPAKRFSQLIRITFFEDRFAFSFNTKEMTLWDLRDLVLTTTAPSKTKLPLLKLAKFGDKLSENASLRYNENVLSISGIEVDYDGEQMAFETALEYLRQARLQSLVYTSPSHTPAKPRWRVLLPTSKELPPDKRAELVARINGVFGGILAVESFTLSQSYYFGSVVSSAEHRAEYTSGDFINLRADLDESAINKYEDAPRKPAEQLGADDPTLIPLALAVIPNEDVVQPEYNRIGMACWAASQGSDEGFQAFDAWAQKSKKYHGGTRKRWKHYFKSPPTKIGAGTIFYMAQQADPNWRNGHAPEKTELGARLANDLIPPKQSKPLNGVPQSKIKSSLVICAADIRPRSKEWLWEGHLLRGAQELLTGVPGLGKSQVQIHFMACLTAGLPWPDGAKAGQPMSVIMLTAEDTLDQEVKPRLMAAGANCDKIFILKCIKHDGKNRQFLLNEDLDQLEKIAAKIGDVGMLAVDPITAYMGGKVDSHKATEVRSQLGPLKDFAEHTGIAVSSITHPPKSGGQKAIDQFIGSQAFIAAGRIGHICVEEFEEGEDGEKKSTGRILFANPKNNAHIKMPTLAFRVEEVFVQKDDVTNISIESPRVVWDGEVVDITADEAVAVSNGMVPVKKREGDQSKLQTLITELLRDGGAPQKTIEAAAIGEGFTVNQLKTAKKKLNILSEREGDAWVWHLMTDGLK